MEFHSIEQRASIYKQPFFKQPTKKKSLETTETMNESLPFINFNMTHVRVNHMRQDLNQTKTQIMLMRSKLSHLRKIKEKFQGKKQENFTKMEFMNSVRDRIRSDALYKQKFHEKQQHQLQLKKLQAEYLRQSLVREKQQAEAKIFQEKKRDVSEEKQKQRKHEYLLKKMHEIELEAKTNLVQSIKQFHQNSASRMKEFHESRITLSKDNYKQKATSTLRQKEKAERLLHKLHQDEQFLLEDVKNSEQAMLSSLYSLEGLNPQKKKQFRFNSSDRSIKLDKDDE